MKTPKPAIYTTYDIGRMTGTDPTTVHKWIDKGLMRGYRTPGGHRRVRGEDLRLFLLAHQMPVPRELGGAGSVRVALVDEDRQALKAASKAIKKLRPSWDVVTVSSHIDALLQLQTLAPDVLVFELFASSIDGFELGRRMRAQPETAGIKLVVTASRQTSDLEKKARAAGISGYLKKPITGPELIAAIETAAGMRPAEIAS